MPESFKVARSGRVIKNDGSIVNTADMIEGIYNALVGGSTEDMKKFASIPANQLAAASTTYWFWYDGVLRPNAGARSFIFSNNFNQVSSSAPAVKFLLYDSIMVKDFIAAAVTPNVAGPTRGYNDTGGINQLVQLTPNFNAGYWAPYHSVDSTSSFGIKLGAPVDSILIQLTTGTGLPTTGTFDIYVREVGVR